MPRSQSLITNWFQYAALRLAAAGMHMFSARRNMATARTIGALLHRFDQRHRERAVQNIRRSMPQLTAAQAERIAGESMRQLLQFGVEVMFTTRLIQPDAWADRVRFTGLERSLDLVLSDRPTILVTGHYGNWEVLGYLMSLLGIDLAAVARPIDNPLINDWVLGVREAKGMRVITKWGATEPMLDLLARGGTLGFIGDQNAGDKGLFVPFFGRLASAYKSIALLAIQFEAPVICGYARRVGSDFRFEVGTSDIIYPEDWKAADDPLYYVTARYTRAIETMVRQAPEQYWWVHRRWKSRPRHERLGKPMPPALRRQIEALPWITPADVESLGRPDVSVDRS